MKKLSLLFASIVFAIPVFAADWCSLRAVASQTGDNVCVEIVPEIDWTKSGVDNLDLLVAVYFYDEWMNALMSDDKLYEAANGQVAANSPCELRSTDSDPSLEICMPIEQLHLGSGEHKLYYTVEIFRYAGDYCESLASTQPYLLKVKMSTGLDGRVAEMVAENEPQYVEKEVAIDKHPENQKTVTKEGVRDISRPIAKEVVSVEDPHATVKSSVSKKKKKDEKAVSRTFSRTYRNVWDDEMCEEMRFYQNGKVELFRIFKGYDENFIKEGTYILNTVEGSPRITIHIDWKTADSEKSWTLGGSSKDHSLFKDKQVWKPVSRK